MALETLACDGSTHKQRTDCIHPAETLAGGGTGEDWFHKTLKGWGPGVAIKALNKGAFSIIQYSIRIGYFCSGYNAMISAP